MKNKTIVTILVLGAVGYWVYTRNKAKKSLNPFAKSSKFTGDEATFFDDTYFNASGRRGCEVYAGNVSVRVPFRLGNGDIVVKTGGGTTVVCPPNQQGIGATSITN